MPEKLDSFILQDALGLSENELFKRAMMSAQYRAEIMGWIDISVERTNDPPFSEGEFTCYTFDLLGTDTAF